MQILDAIHREARKRNLELLVIGGHAVNAYGIARNTLDLDLLVSREDRQSWKKLLEDLKYTIFHEHENFVQFSPPDSKSWPIDLMLVDDAGFRKMLEGGQDVRWGGAAFKVPRIEHLIALKLHSYKSGIVEREIKDLHDLLELIRASGIAAESDAFKKFCLQYVSLEQYERVREAVRRFRKS